MAKLWQKGYELDAVVEEFTVGDDPLLDRELIFWDAVGSMAHARMLASIGILTEEEADRLCACLAEIVDLDRQGRFDIPRELEDVHTAVENYLTERLGDLGKKIHTARSRNDQVVLDLRLYMRDRLLAVGNAALDLASTLCDFAARHRRVPIPGRTHFQRAMPSSVGLWAGAFAESLSDDVRLLTAVADILDQSPLGSAASYGVNLPIDRAMVASLLGFRKVQNNVLYANNSRGKMEAMLLSGCVQIADDLAKLAADVILWSMPEFGYFRLPERFCPGSSLMPQKRNPGPFELTRAGAASVQACLMEILETIRPLISGYHRDFQITKGPMMRGVRITLNMLKVNNLCIPEIEVDREACIRSFTPELFATDRVLDLARQGVPFREAYRQVAATLDETSMEDPVANIMGKRHQGAPGNLGLGAVRRGIRSARALLQRMEERWNGRIRDLLERSRKATGKL